MNKDVLLNQIREDCTHLFMKEVSVEKWSEIWNASCEKVANRFEAEGLIKSANKAREWKSC